LPKVCAGLVALQNDISGQYCGWVSAAIILCGGVIVAAKTSGEEEENGR